MTDNAPGHQVAITLQMGFPTVMEPGLNERNPCRIEINEETAGIRLLELELTGDQLLALLARRRVQPTVTFAHPHPERAGHPQTRWTETFPSNAEAEALAFRDWLKGHGWSTGDPSRSNSHAHKFTVTGRRWDGERAGSLCISCRSPLPFGEGCQPCATDGAE